jgi:hypothetical protein
MENSEVPQDANEGCPGLSSQEAGKNKACAGCPNQKICSSKKQEIDPCNFFFISTKKKILISNTILISSLH